MILTGALVILLLATYGAAVIHAMAVTGLSRGQALLYAPLKLLYRIGDRPIRANSALMNPMSKFALCATSLAPSMKAANSSAIC